VYFAIRKNESGQFSWRAVADNNEILAASETLQSKDACTNAINVVKEQAASAEIKDQTAES
jgi:uncharacterized protein YegP (UPF0339 family)